MQYKNTKANNTEYVSGSLTSLNSSWINFFLLRRWINLTLSDCFYTSVLYHKLITFPITVLK